MPDPVHKSLIMRHAPGVIRTHNLLIRSQILYHLESVLPKAALADVGVALGKSPAGKAFKISPGAATHAISGRRLRQSPV
jgi:hypothetical protein